MNKKILFIIACICFLINAPHMRMWFNPGTDPYDYYELSNNMLEGKWMWICQDYYFHKGCHREENRYPFYPLFLMPFVYVFQTHYILQLITGVFYMGALYVFYKLSDKLTTFCFMSLTYHQMFTGGLESIYLFFVCLFFYYVKKKNYLWLTIVTSLTVLTRPSVGLSLLVVFCFYIFIEGHKKHLLYPVVPFFFVLFMVFTSASNSNSMFLNKYLESSNYYHSIAYPPQYTPFQKAYNYFHNVYLAFFHALPVSLLFFTFFVPFMLLKSILEHYLKIIFILALGLLHSLYFIEPRYMLTSSIALLVLYNYIYDD